MYRFEVFCALAFRSLRLQGLTGFRVYFATRLADPFWDHSEGNSRGLVGPLP